MKFKKEDLIEMAYDDEPEGFKIIKTNLIDTTRWELVYEQIFKHDYKFFKTHFNLGATESQENLPYEDEEGMIDVTEVKPVEKKVLIYEDM